MRDRRHAGDPDRERAGPRATRRRSTAARVVGVTGGTSTPIEDLRDVAERIFELAGTPDAMRPTPPSSPGRALDAAAHAGRPHDLAARAPASRRRRGLTGARPHSPACPVVAFVGRPNVGKSTLFNRVVGDARAAIVEDRARTTRDRLYGDAEWNGRRFVVVDTGGLEIAPGDPIEEQVQVQARLAIGEADVIVFLVDAETGPTPADQDAAELLRRTTKPVLVAANKADNEKRELDAAEFYAFGWEDTFAISRQPRARRRGPARRRRVGAAARERRGDRAQGARGRGRGVGEGDGRAAGPTPYVVGRRRGSRRDDDDGERGRRRGRRARRRLGRGRPLGRRRWPPRTTSRRRSRSSAGRTSASRASLNALLGETRTIVSEIPGTTRDAIDTTIPWGRSEIVLIDTAGIRQRGKVASGPAAETLLDDAGAQGDLARRRRGARARRRTTA